MTPNPSRYHDHRDANEPGIVMALLKAGATVERDGPLDLIVGYRKQNYLLEIKLPAGRRGGTSRSQLNKNQRDFFQRWHGQCVVVRTPQEALDAIGALTSTGS